MKYQECPTRTTPVSSCCWFDVKKIGLRPRDDIGAVPQDTLRIGAYCIPCFGENRILWASIAPSFALNFAVNSVTFVLSLSVYPAQELCYLYEGSCFVTAPIT